MGKLMGLGIVLMASSQLAFAHEYIDRARVLSVSPQVQNINQPRQECRTDYIRESVYQQPARSNTGAIIGGVAGGLLGSTIGGRVAAAAVGAGVGAIVGDRVDNQNTYGREQVVTRPVQQCVVVDQWQTVTTGYMVNYEYQGRHYNTVMDRYPGAFIDVTVMSRPQYMQVQPVAVAYRPAAHRPKAIKGHAPHKPRHHWQ
jgi:uncharacterized protein YcfJ